MLLIAGGSRCRWQTDLSRSRSQTDALGRLIKVIENPAGPATYAASYSYDSLDNLTDVSHGSLSADGTIQTPQTRQFHYDSLRRFTQAYNPESGTITYTYDVAGNLVRKQDAAVVTCYGTLAADGSTCNSSNGYDSFNRVLKKTYSDGTPAVAYTYDTDLAISGHTETNYPVGRLASVTTTDTSPNGVSTSTVYRYDPLSKVTASAQTVGSAGPYPFGYGYNRAGALATLTYPSNAVVTYGFDGAGRVNWVKKGANYAAQSVTYTPHDAIASMQLGRLFEKTLYNNRLQPTDMMLGTSLGVSDRWELQNQYWETSSGAASNNGNVIKQILNVNGSSTAITEEYQYDSFNRLKTATEGGNWKQVYVYDALGNRALVKKDSDGKDYYIPGGAWTPQVTADDPTQVAAMFPGNRWTGTGVQYDNGVAGGVGNLTGLSGFVFGYDGENRQTTAVGGETAARYTYDGNGRRVQKVNCPAGTSPCTVTTYVYDAMGKLAAEYSTDPGTSPCTMCYLTADHLGSTRVMTDGATGAVVALHDYLPFGEEIPDGMGGRGVLYGMADPKQKFTGKERDAETGLDYFGARYYSGAQGRFTRADEPFNDQDPANPQSWNLYTYGRNNPLLYVDPTGSYVCAGSVTPEQCDSFQRSLDQAQTAASALKDKYGADSKQYTDAQAAISAYGEQGKDNGVTIAIGDTGRYGAVTAIANAAGPTTDDNYNGQKITVTFNDRTIGNVPLATHEGSHVADASTYVSSGFDQSWNPTNRQTETTAYQVGSNIGIGMGWLYQRVAFDGHAPYLLNYRGWPQANTDNMINAILNQQYRNLDQRAFPAPAPRRRR